MGLANANSHLHIINTKSRGLFPDQSLKHAGLSSVAQDINHNDGSSPLLTERLSLIGVILPTS